MYQKRHLVDGIQHNLVTFLKQSSILDYVIMGHSEIKLQSIPLIFHMIYLNQILKPWIMFGLLYGGTRWLLDGMTTIKSLFLFSLIFVIGFFCGLFFPLVSNLIFYGALSGPCVWPTDYEAMGFGSVEDLEYSELYQCYLKPF